MPDAKPSQNTRGETPAGGAEVRPHTSPAGRPQCEAVTTLVGGSRVYRCDKRPTHSTEPTSQEDERHDCYVTMAGGGLAILSWKDGPDGD